MAFDGPGGLKLFHVLGMHLFLDLSAEPAQLVHRLRVRFFAKLDSPRRLNLGLVDVGFPPTYIYTYIHTRRRRKANGCSTHAISQLCWMHQAMANPRCFVLVGLTFHCRSCREPPPYSFLEFYWFQNPRYIHRKIKSYSRCLPPALSLHTTSYGKLCNNRGVFFPPEQESIQVGRFTC